MLRNELCTRKKTFKIYKDNIREESEEKNWMRYSLEENEVFFKILQQ